MIQFSGLDTFAMSEQTGFTRLARQPEDQEGAFSPLELLMEEGPLTPVIKENREQASLDESDEVTDNAEAQLDAFSNIPHPFLVHDPGARAAIDSSGVATVIAGHVEAAEDGGGDVRSVSALLRELSTYRQPGSEKGHSAIDMSRFGKQERAATDLSGFMLAGSPVRSDDATQRERTIASLQGLLGVEVRESGTPDLKGIVNNPVSTPVSKVAEYQWAPVTLAEKQQEWGQKLVGVLKDKIELQVNQQIKQAHIRLDPPELGRLELTVRVEGDRLNVQLNVANPAVREALSQSMERLRISLAPHHAGGVDVNVGQGGEQGDTQGAWRQEKILAGRRHWQDEFEAARQSERSWLNTLV